MLELKALKADITTLQIDAIVNAANESLMRGGGVCGAIFRASGPQLDEACREIGSCRTGHAVTTAAFDLKTAKFIIHAVGPVYRAGADSHTLLASTYESILSECQRNGITSVAIPCISTGIYGYPSLPAAGIAVSTVKKLAHTAPILKSVTFCCFNDDDLKLYEKLLAANTASPRARL